MRRCKHCREYAKNGVQHPGGWFCSQEHAIAYAMAKQAKQKAAKSRAKRIETKKALDGIKTRSEWLREAQIAFNGYVRERDAGRPCISCGRPDDGSHQRHASHYRPVGNNPALRFDERNVWASCATCNNHLSGNLIEYRKGLIAKVGAEVVDWLEGPHEPAKWTIEQIKQIRDEYRKKTRELKRLRSALA